jgi:hypothetical protein
LLPSGFTFSAAYRDLFAGILAVLTVGSLSARTVRDLDGLSVQRLGRLQAKSRIATRA